MNQRSNQIRPWQLAIYCTVSALLWYALGWAV
jgi:hypothetical protein